MIEIPRACLLADKMAKTARVLLVRHQRPDPDELRLQPRRHRRLPARLPGQEASCQADPFQTIDQEGVGQLIQMAVEKGRATRPNLKIGICGEQGGDPASVEVLLPSRAELRELPPVPRADRPAGGGPGGAEIVRTRCLTRLLYQEALTIRPASGRIGCRQFSVLGARHHAAEHKRLRRRLSNS